MWQTNKTFLLTVAGIVVLGFLAGVVGELWLNSFLLPDPYLNFKNYSDLTKRINDLVSGQTTVNSGQTSLATQKAQPAVARIYRYKKVSTSGSGLLASDLLGQGLIITSDGWIVTNSRVASSAYAPTYLIGLANRPLLASKKVVLDPVSGLTFLKVDANNLVVGEFILKNNLSLSEPVYFPDASGGLIVDYVKNNNYARLANESDLLHSTEKFYKFVQLQNALSDEIVGAPMITANGKIAGLFVKGDIVIPIDYMTALMKAMVKGEKWVRPYLGLKFYDLSELININISDNRGALIAKSGVAIDSPAKGIILPDDIILKVESDELGVKNNLSGLISQYRPGDTLKFTLKRQGSEMTMDVKLK